ncbi:hypothetical protein M407DRAFT_17763 [Tulasnella calospora MUT 4182]|uniref:Uncharacterized protein n=1 Tax=Tulasnella calospora MUT 4182 TaxID=1051891 RepID=A0A0C3MIJ4_9AGAM|nr:hypothetical protein M407DRAFT_17763 [Tulasnella calospora MUT 4182]
MVRTGDDSSGGFGTSVVAFKAKEWLRVDWPGSRCRQWGRIHSQLALAEAVRRPWELGI